MHILYKNSVHISQKKTNLQIDYSNPSPKVAFPGAVLITCGLKQ